MSTSGQLLFIFSAMMALLSAIGVVTMKNALRAAVSLLVHVVSLALLYLTLHAHLLAAIQMLVYAGAVVVLFVFVIMLLGPTALETKPSQKGRTGRTIGVAGLFMVMAGLAAQVSNTQALFPAVAACDPGVAECNQFGGVAWVSDYLFTVAAVPFEMASALLLVAILAAIAVARGHSPTEKEKLEGRKRVVVGTNDLGTPEMASIPNAAE